MQKDMFMKSYSFNFPFLSFWYLPHALTQAGPVHKTPITIVTSGIVVRGTYNTFVASAPINARENPEEEKEVPNTPSLSSDAAKIKLRSQLAQAHSLGYTVTCTNCSSHPRGKHHAYRVEKALVTTRLSASSFFFRSSAEASSISSWAMASERADSIFSFWPRLRRMAVVGSETISSTREM
jgi:hypothetical protein